MKESEVAELALFASAYGKYAELSLWDKGIVLHKYFKVTGGSIPKKTPIGLMLNDSFNIEKENCGFAIIDSRSEGVFNFPKVESDGGYTSVKVGEEEVIKAKAREDIDVKRLPYLHIELLRIALEAFNARYISEDTFNSCIYLANIIANKEVLT